MITPATFLSKLSQTRGPLYERQLAEIREHIDAAILRAATSGAGTVRVEHTRSGWSTAAVSAVVAEYVAAGWVAYTGSSQWLVQLSPPEAE